MLKIRVTYISNVRNTKIGNVINFHGMDDTGEISFYTFGESCHGIYNYLKVQKFLNEKIQYFKFSF